MKFIDWLILMVLRIILFASFIVIAGILTWKLLYSEDSRSNSIHRSIAQMKLTSSAFKEGEIIPKTYSCDGENINPPLTLIGIPKQAKSWVIIVDDPDATLGTWNHWIVWNIPREAPKIKENLLPKGAVLGTNDGGKLEYGGPCPPEGTHHYYFRAFALDTTLDLPQGVSRTFLNEAMKDHIVGKAVLMGVFSR